MARKQNAGNNKKVGPTLDRHNVDSNYNEQQNSKSSKLRHKREAGYLSSGDGDGEAGVGLRALTDCTTNTR